jgi:Spy/CpxP family protein refolding chaperone
MYLPLHSPARRRLGALVLTLFLFVGTAAAQPQGGRQAGRGDGREPFRELIFEPELVMQSQREIGLTPEQRQRFIREVQQTHSDMVPMQVEMVEASANLLELLEPAAVDEEAALAAADRMMTLELEVKARRMVLLVRIKNLLTAEQQRQLREIRDEGP